ncbi:MAG: AAA family ATPase [Patescibacteria group bacterium]|nr:AAA family ATPase [Patescibacteria group bacterium]
MNRPYRNIIKASSLYPVLVLEDWFSRRARLVSLRFSQVILLLGLFVAGLYWWSGAVINLPLVIGLALLYLVLVLVVSLIEAYFRSHYYGSIIINEYGLEARFTFTVGRILYWATKRKDFLAGFLASQTGKRMMRRAGIKPAEWQAYLSERREIIELNLADRSKEILKLRPVVDTLLSADSGFSSFLFRHNIKPADFLAIADWVVREIELQAITERWWAWDSLRRRPRLGADWSYGVGYFLERFSHNLLVDQAAWPSPLALARPRLPELDRLETALLRSKESNALIIGEAGQGKMELIWQLAREINGQKAPSSLLSRRLMLLNTTLLLSRTSDEKTLESALLHLLEDARDAGNVILVIDNFAALARSADQYGVNLAGLLDPFLSVEHLPMIALADTGEFHQVLEPRTALIRRFERLMLAEVDPAVLLQALQDQVIGLEARHRVTFTYGALKEVVTASERYLQGEAVSDQAADLLVGLIPIALKSGQRLITQQLVWDHVEQKTGIPLGEVTVEERETLTNLEAELGRRVIGQGEALKLVASAIKRNRAGVRNPKRPAGSFLFLGPTGVGKTETAKSLVAVLFGRPGDLLRLDMSEFQGPDALERLIGSFDSDQPGILANLVREHPYGVLLLDEFEKMNHDAINLFLQIFDEGLFSDATGKRINARNLVFIATSNAGAELIWSATASNDDPGNLKNELINHLVSERLFKPELLNRFDGLVVFRPLEQDALRQVAHLLLNKLVKRLRDRGLELVLNDELVELVATGGYNKQFGARPMSRFIQERVEQTVADQLISGELKTGDRLLFQDGKIKSLI